MILDTFFDQVNSAYRGSDDDAPAAGTPDYTLWLLTTNRKINEWATDGKNTWRSLFSINPIGTVSAGNQDYDLDDNLLIPSDRIVITETNKNTIEYMLVTPQERERYYHSAYIHGAGPQTLTFYDPILAANQIVGGTINVPGYYLPDDMTGPSSIIPVDDPYWLVYAVAAELAGNDITYASKAPDLESRANARYKRMASNNRRGTSNSVRQLSTNVNRIPDTRTNRIDNATPNYGGGY